MHDLQYNKQKLIVVVRLILKEFEEYGILDKEISGCTMVGMRKTKKPYLFLFVPQARSLC